MDHSPTVVVTQSNYLPWRGWFDMVRQADYLVLLDSVQYTRRDWRNRNRIKSRDGLVWLTVPVNSSGHFERSIDEICITSPKWAEMHLRSIEASYKGAAHFGEEFIWLSESLRGAGEERMLSRVNEMLIRSICKRLRLPTRIMRDTDLIPKLRLCAYNPSERLAVLTEAVGRTALSLWSSSIILP